MSLKPMLACDAVESRIQFPVIVQPKIDGVRMPRLLPYTTGRSLKPFGNKFTNERYSSPELLGLDGELVYGNVTDSDLCRKTSSATSSHNGSPETMWYVFDSVQDGEYDCRLYNQRQHAAIHRIYALHDKGYTYIKYVEHVLCASMEDLLYIESKFLEQGYEGVILRDPNGKYKSGRSTVREGGLLRIKRFVEDTATVVQLLEGETNNNEALTNELGQTYRTSHQENKVANGLLGSLLCETKDGKMITVSAGSMTHEERKYYLENPTVMTGSIVVYKHFPIGVKNKPRFPTFVSIK